MKFTKIMAVVLSVAMLMACAAFSASAEVTNIALADFTPGHLNMDMTATGDNDLGLTLEGPWQDTQGWGYAYWNLTAEEIEETPYLVVEIAPESVALFGGWCSISNGYVNELIKDFRPAAGEAPERMVIDLSQYDAAAAGTLCICITTAQEAEPLVFNALYLSDDANGTVEGGNQGGAETGAESAVAVAVAAVIGAGALFAVSRKMK